MLLRGSVYIFFRASKLLCIPTPERWERGKLDLLVCSCGNRRFIIRDEIQDVEDLYICPECDNQDFISANDANQSISFFMHRVVLNSIDSQFDMLGLNI